MPVLFACILGLIQALTEFLPVSSSGHLVVTQTWLEGVFHTEPTPVAFGVLLHLATLIVVVVYLREDLLQIARGFLSRDTSDGRALKLTLALIVGTAPAAVVGLCFKHQIEELFHSVDGAANGFLVTSLLLLATQYGFERRTTPSSEIQAGEHNSHLNWQIPSLRQSLAIGLFQALAIVPGISRSGSTICSALLMGLPAEAALRFSFLLSIPAILGAGLLEAKELAVLGEQNLLAYISGFLVTMAVGWLALSMLVIFTKRRRLLPFALYTLFLGVTVRFL